MSIGILDKALVVTRASEASLARMKWIGPVLKPMGSMGFSAEETFEPVLRNYPDARLLQLGNGLKMLVAEKRFPVPHFEAYATPVTQPSLPIISSDLSVDLSSRFMLELDRPLILRNAPLDHPVLAELDAMSKQTTVLRQWQRAALSAETDFETWMAENFDHKRRKELKRLRNRLGEQGTLEITKLSENADIPAFLHEFLELEDRSWKGQGGTSILKSKQALETLRTSLSNFETSGKLRFWSMRFNGKSIASIYAVVDQGLATLGKIAHDDAFAKYSPGVLLIIDITKDFLSDKSITLIDSNAIPNHPMIDRIWRDRKDVGDVLVTPHQVSMSVSRLLENYDRSYFKFRGHLKSLYYRVKGVRPS